MERYVMFSAGDYWILEGDGTLIEGRLAAEELARKGPRLEGVELDRFQQDMRTKITEPVFRLEKELVPLH